MARRLPQPAAPSMTEREATIAIAQIEGGLIPTTMERRPCGEPGDRWTASTPSGRESLAMLERVKKLRARREKAGVPLVEILAEIRALVAVEKNMYGRTYAEVIGLAARAE